MKLKIKKGSTVEIIAGADKGKRGAVLEIDPIKLRVRVQGVRMQTYFDKQDGISTKEGLLDYSNIKLIESAAATAKKSKSKAKEKAAGTRK